jgi:hypothetical protein
MENKAERDTKVKWCRDDAARQTTTNCMNATTARDHVMLQPNAPTSFDNFSFDNMPTQKSNQRATKP